MSFQYEEQEPCEHSPKIVSKFFYAHGRIDYAFDRILPTPFVVVVLNLGNPHRVGKCPDIEQNPTCSKGWVTGVQISPVYNAPLNGTHVFGCIFDPIGFHSAFNIEMKAWANSSAPLEYADGLGALDELQAEICRLATSEECFSRANLWLRMIALDDDPIPSWLRRGYEAIKESEGSIALESLYADLDVSGRHFNERFQHAVGLTPKAYCRLLRLSSLLPQLDPSGADSLANLAGRCGYSDQSHFNRDFIEFTGVNPTEYFRKRTAEYGDVPKGSDPLFVPHSP